MAHVIKSSVSLVTGGASGLGKATAERFIQHGGKVVILDLPSSDGENVAKQLGKNCIFAPADVTNVNQVNGVIKKIKSVFGQLNNVVNCAGIGIAARSYNFKKNEAHKLELFNKVLLVNAAGVFNVSTQAVSLLNENENESEVKSNSERGVIINTSSVAAFDGQIGQVAYSASKGAIASMTLPLARDLSARRIRVVTIAPGLFATPLLTSLPEKVQTSLAQSVPYPKRLGDPSEFAHLCQSIVENPMLNGEIIRLDGALRMMP